MNLFDFTEIPADGEHWVRFAQEFLQLFGFHIETPPYRDTENVFDFCAVEQISGKFNSHPFRWLVSCRHKAATRTAVKESEEADILERLLRSRADGFIGFYSTSASSALEFYLAELKNRFLVKGYRILDAKFLEMYLATPGFARISFRYFPNYAQTHPVLHLVDNNYLPILCEHCRKDLFKTLFTENQEGVIVRLRRRKETPTETEIIANLYVACKGECDAELQAKYCSEKKLNTVGWTDLSDLVDSSAFLDWTLSLLRKIGTDELTYTTSALEKELYLLKALAQYTLREPTNKNNPSPQLVSKDNLIFD
ncbi:MAG: hypothetical protein LBC74_02080 [Planctomycetaceae bacterium]|jgi:hypothetical protein|nr:hypothetical protein [Planctomycetaceae bacterium]